MNRILWQRKGWLDIRLIPLVQSASKSLLVNSHANGICRKITKEKKLPERRYQNQQIMIKIAQFLKNISNMTGPIKCISNLSKEFEEMTTGSSEFRCPTCDEVFSQRSNLKRHLISHNPDPKKFECEQCGRFFNRRDNIVKHQQRQHKMVNISVDLLKKS